MVGLFSQTLTGNQLINGQELYFGPGYRFYGGQLGVTLPLLGQAQKSRINAARIGEQIAQADLTSQQFASISSCNSPCGNTISTGTP